MTRAGTTRSILGDLTGKHKQLTGTGGVGVEEVEGGRRGGAKGEEW